MARRNSRGQFKRTDPIRNPELFRDQEKLKAEIIKLSKTANSRLSRLRAAERQGKFTSPALERRRKQAGTNTGTFNAYKKIDSLNNNRLQVEYTYLLDFLQNPTSTVSGAKKQWSKQEEFLYSIGLNPQEYSSDKIAEFFDLYHKLIEAKSQNFMYSGPGDRVPITAFATIWKEGNIRSISTKQQRTRRKGKRKGQTVTDVEYDYAEGNVLDAVIQQVRDSIAREDAFAAGDDEEVESIEQRMISRARAKYDIQK